MKRIVRTEIDASTDGTLLIELLVRRFTYHDRSRWGERIAERRLLVNGAPAGPEAVLRTGDLLEYRIPPVAEPEVPCSFQIVYEDDDLLAVNKPAGLPVHPAGRFFNHTLWALLKEQRPGEPFELVNRLDRETSGLVLLGRHTGATRACRRQMEARRVAKEYLVLVEGEFPGDLTAAGWTIPDPDSPVRKKRRFVQGDVSPGTREAAHCITQFARLGFSAGISLLLAQPRTGRLHQIRATLCGLGYPVVGDKMYGVEPGAFLRFVESGELSASDRARLRLERQALHAWRLGLRHPSSGVSLVLEAGPPTDLCDLCAVLGLNLPASLKGCP